MLRISATALLLRLFYGSLLLQAFSTLALAHVTTDTGTDMGFLGDRGAADTVPKKGHVPLDVDGYPAAPPELELEQVHIYVRHGT